ncbi:aquaporin-like protein [Elsinoe ampelina]|uniref:Aquaporin-like protein n=1 Tax=Elsinoe ampelina TaxID=302913 RepID=A0A6A6GBR9_9PEZI|nr:aquaporin-like protein [Elsinoe ampelina]
MPRNYIDGPVDRVKGGRRAASERSAWKNHLVATTSEFVGTFLFLYFAYAGHQMAVDQAGQTGPNGTVSAQTVIYIAMAYGFSLLVTVWTLYRVSGGLFNPAITFALCITRNLSWVRGLLFFPAQLLGAICAAALVESMTPGGIERTRTRLAPGMTIARGVFFEMFLTAQLTLTVLMLAAEKSKDTFIAPIGIGLSLFVAEIAGVYYTGGSLNPARSFGPCVADASFEGYHWIYWVGPFLGAAIAAGYYSFIKYLHYEDANPGQDDNSKENAHRDNNADRVDGGEV